jgi:flagellar biosynthetic protein FliQ
MEGQIADLGRDTLVLVIKLTAPVLLAGLAVGLLVSILQALTQIQEMTLTFVPKIAAVAVALVVFGPWMLANLTEFTNAVFAGMAQPPQ